MPWSRLPSISAKPGAGSRRSMAICMALMRALRISVASISSASTRATAQATATVRIVSYRASRRLGVTCLESLSPSMEHSGGRMTAPA